VKRIPRPVIGLLALVVAAAGCGSSASMSDTASHQLETLVASVRTATVARDRPRAKRALASLRHSVHSLVVSGDISKSRAAEILDAARLVETHLAPFTTTTTTTTTTTAPTPHDEHHDRPKHHGKDKGDEG
jgi:hypothetical protein